MIRKYKTKPTKLRVEDYVYIEQKRLKVGDSSHLTASFIGPFIISERVDQASFKVKHCHTMKELSSPIHAERTIRLIKGHALWTFEASMIINDESD